MLDALTRRAAVFGAGAISLAGVAGAALAVSPASASSSAAAAIDAAAARCRAAKETLAAALNAYERALPPPHFSLDMTGRRPARFDFTAERRLFDGDTPDRATDFRGHPNVRYVATEETIAGDLQRCPSEDRERRRLLLRMHRRAKARAAKIEALEDAFYLRDLDADVSDAEHQLNELMQELFERQATTMAAVLVQAKALSAYTSLISAQYATYQAGRYGALLAAGLQTVARAA